MPRDPRVPEMQAGPRCALLPKSTDWFVLVLLETLQGKRDTGHSVLPRPFFGGEGGKGVQGRKKGPCDRCCSCNDLTDTMALKLCLQTSRPHSGPLQTPVPSQPR